MENVSIRKELREVEDLLQDYKQRETRHLALIEKLTSQQSVVHDTSFLHDQLTHKTLPHGQNHSTAGNEDTVHLRYSLEELNRLAKRKTHFVCCLSALLLYFQKLAMELQYLNQQPRRFLMSITRGHWKEGNTRNLFQS